MIGRRRSDAGLDIGMDHLDGHEMKVPQNCDSR
jgi:hypothetical protein